MNSATKGPTTHPLRSSAVATLNSPFYSTGLNSSRTSCWTNSKTVSWNCQKRTGRSTDTMISTAAARRRASTRVQRWRMTPRELTNWWPKSRSQSKNPSCQGLLPSRIRVIRGRPQSHSRTRTTWSLSAKITRRSRWAMRLTNCHKLNPESQSSRSPIQLGWRSRPLTRNNLS